MLVPAACRNCGTIFPSGINVENSINVSFKGCTAGPCPNCGGTGDIIDGTFDFVGNAIRVKHAPQRTIDVLRVLQDALAQASAGRPTEEIFAKLAEASPEAAEQAVTLYSKGGLPMVLVFIFLIMQSLANNTSGKVNWNTLFDQAKVAILGGEPYPGLTTGSVGSAPSEQEVPAPPSQSEDTSEQHKQRPHQPQPRPRKQQPEIGSNWPETSKIEAPKPPRQKNHRRKQAERAARRSSMKGAIGC